MSSVEDHYDKLLAPVYTWMAGGSAVAFALGQSDLETLLQGKKGFAIDLGAGFGMHSVPLARAGWRVLAVDTSPMLLGELVTSSAGLAVRTHCGDLLDFAAELEQGERADLILCMGDTLTHLDSPDAVTRLAQEVAAHLTPGGRFVATFRDYSRLPVDEARFIPVRADADRILTCFLEEHADHVQVHDLLHERVDGQWRVQVSSYRKLRLAPDWVRQTFMEAGLQTMLESGPRGMLRLTTNTVD